MVTPTKSTCHDSGADQRSPSPLDRSPNDIAESSAITTAGRGTAMKRRIQKLWYAAA